MMKVEWLEPWIFFWVSQLVLEERMWLVVQRAPMAILRSYVRIEFLVYQAVCFLVFAIWLPSTFPLLRKVCANERRCAGRLLRYDENAFYDLSDSQWRDFSRAAPLLAIVCLAGTAMGHIAGKYQAVVRGLTALAVLWVSHGNESILLIALFALSALCKRLPLLLWLLVVVALILKEPRQAVQLSFGLDGGLRRWYQAVPLLILRTTSFSLDTSQSSSRLLDGFIYVFYVPLQATGPTIRFAHFKKTNTSTARLSYILRTAVAWYIFHKALGRVPSFSLISTPGLLASLAKIDASAAAALVFLALNFIWLKFTVIWRFAKCLALIDGVDPPENMRRFVCNNFTIAGFWRDWHASFYEWLQYYLYQPLLRRTKSKVLATTTVFAFVVVWHDLEPKLYLWGCLNALCIALERFSGLDRAARNYVQAEAFQSSIPSTSFFWQRARLSALGALYITLLVVANAIGFATHSFDDLFYACKTAFFSQARHYHQGLLGLCLIFIVFFVGTQNALLVRSLEARYLSSSSSSIGIKS